MSPGLQQGPFKTLRFCCWGRRLCCGGWHWCGGARAGSRPNKVPNGSRNQDDNGPDKNKRSPIHWSIPLSVSESHQTRPQLPSKQGRSRVECPDQPLGASETPRPCADSAHRRPLTANCPHGVKRAAGVAQRPSRGASRLGRVSSGPGWHQEAGPIHPSKIQAGSFDDLMAIPLDRPN
jgi:hypothetical protein